MPTFPAYIDNTMRKAFAVCPTKFRYEHMENLRPVGAKSIHLQFGGAFAKGLEVTREAHWESATGSPGSKVAVELGIEAALEAFAGADSEGTYKTADRLEGALRYYFKTWPLDEEKIVPVEGGIERSFSLPLPILHPDTGKPINYVGRYDMLGQHVLSRDLWVVDEKTASRLGDMWDAKWDLDCQIAGYIWSVRRSLQLGLLPGPGAVGVRGMVRAVSILKDSYGHSEVPMVRSAWYIDRWYGQLCRDVQRAVESYKLGVWDLALHENACVQYGRRCDFNQLCLTPHPHRLKDELHGLFRVEVWNPLDKGEG